MKINLQEDYKALSFLQLNTIFTVITQKTHATFRHILKGADVGILWSYMVEETGILVGNQGP